MGSASTHPPTCYHLHQYPSSMGQVFPSHLWGVSRPICPPHTPRLDFLAAQLHIRDSTLPRHLLHRSRGPPTIRSEYVALQPHLDPSPPPNRMYVVRTNCPSFSTSVCRATSPSVLPTAPTVCLSPRKSVALSVHPPTVRPSSPPVRHPNRPSTLPPRVHHPTTSVRLSYITPSARHPNQSVRPSSAVPTSVRHPNPSVRPSATITPSVRHTNQSVSLSVTSRLSDCHYDSSARTSVLPHDSPYTRLEPIPSREQDSNHSLAVVNGEQDSNHSLAVVNGEQSHTLHRTQDSSQSLAVMNGEQSRKAKIFHRAFTNYDLLLCA